ncbi:hypothetical protein K9M74_01545 [Candidatus Woesearchaeota archaeon]|nr:hypothetical protein [Candidatus Woesearchaeota archaeon]
MIELGGNITLVGFKELGYAEFVVVKKVVGNYARKISDKQEFSNLTITLKPIHKIGEEISKYELKGKLEIDGKLYNSEVVEHNLFVGIDSLLKKLVAQLKLN